jgi:hypothetical protein
MARGAHVGGAFRGGRRRRPLGGAVPRRALVAAIVFVWSAPVGAEGDLYRWVDESGRVHYSNAPSRIESRTAPERIEDRAAPPAAGATGTPGDRGAAG